MSIAALAVAVLMPGCTQTDDPAASTTTFTIPTPQDSTTTSTVAGAEVDGFVVLAQGDEPRSELTITGSTETAVAVTAIEVTSATVDGEATAETTTATYDVSLTLDATGQVISLTGTPVLVAIDSPFPVPESLETWRWELSPSGSVTAMEIVERQEIAERIGADQLR